MWQEQLPHTSGRLNWYLPSSGEMSVDILWLWT